MNALDLGPPPVPQPNPQSPDQGGNALAGPGMPQMGGGMAAQRQAPTHTQTVATLLHLHAFEQMYRSLAAMPELGKSNIRSKAIDGVTNLVAERFISAAQAITLLEGLPNDVQEQRRWVMQHFARDRAAEAALLAHHSAGSLEGIDYNETPTAGRPDDHAGVLGGVMAMYGGR